MATVSFPFYKGCVVTEVEFHRNDGPGKVTRRLLIDSGFTGQSAFVLSSSDESILIQRIAPDSTTQGALRGRQRRIWVTCELAGLQFQDTLLAICTDLAPLALPIGVSEVGGLRFLCCFSGWGGERGMNGVSSCGRTSHHDQKNRYYRQTTSRRRTLLLRRVVR